MPDKPKTKTKKIYYRRAVFSGSNARTLESYLLKAHEQFHTTASRTFPGGVGGFEISGAHYKKCKNTGLYLQIVSYVPGQPTSTVSKPSDDLVAKIEEASAPPGSDFMEGDLFALVKDNDVLLCPSGARENVALAYFLQILEKMGKKKTARTLELERVAKIDKIKMINKNGVKEIQLASSLYEASIEHVKAQEGNSVNALKRVVADQIKRIFSKDATLKEIQEKENINVKVIIRFNGKEAMKHQKEPDFGIIGKKRLAEASKKLLQETDEDPDDGFKIVTWDNNEISANDVRVSEKYRIEKFGKSLDRANAWEKLEEYYYQLQGTGIIAQ